MKPYYTLELLYVSGDWCYCAEYLNLTTALDDAKFHLKNNTLVRQARIKNQFDDVIESF